jgi:hypothetical protein
MGSSFGLLVLLAIIVGVILTVAVIAMLVIEDVLF